MNIVDSTARYIKLSSSTHPKLLPNQLSNFLAYPEAVTAPCHGASLSKVCLHDVVLS
jgi:hypothetical protein